jgi:Helix-turn-helix domain
MRVKSSKNEVQHGTRMAAKLIGKVEQTVRNLCERGELKATRTSSGRFLVTQSEIDRFNRKQKK